MRIAQAIGALALEKVPGFPSGQFYAGTVLRGSITGLSREPYPCPCDTEPA